MTQPAQQHAHVQPPPDESPMVRQVAEALLVGAGIALTAAAVVKILRAFGVSIPVRAASLALSLVERRTQHLPRMRGSSDVVREQRRVEAFYRAAYVIAAARRIAKSLEAGMSPRAALRKERPFWQQHEAARRNRMSAGAAVAEAAVVWGPLLGWHTVLDGRATPECIAADGTNFSAFEPPWIGWPGTLHGGTCRCYAGKPFPYARTTDEATAHFTAGRRARQRSA